MRASLSRLLTLILVVCFVFPAPVFCADRPSIVEASADSHSNIDDPEVQGFARLADTIPLNLGIAPNDVALDEDPFFLRSQTWEPTPAAEALGEAESPRFLKNGSDLTVWLPGMKRALRLGAGVHLVSVGDRYAWFALDSSDSYSHKRQGAGGLFFLERAQLLAASFSGEPVPVFFFPLPGKGWEGEVRSVELPLQEITGLVSTTREVLPISWADVETILKAESMNLSLAQALGAKVSNGKPLSPATFFPPRGSTAGFGIFFTGFALDQPEASLFTALPTHSRGSGIARSFTEFFGIPSAYADIPAAMYSKLVRVGAVVSLGLIASVVLRYTVYREYYAKKNLGRTGVVQHARDVGDLFAHVLTVEAQIPAVWFGNLVELIGDRFFPKLFSAENSLVRRFLEQTVYFCRDANTRTPVNHKTWLMGALVFGSIDSVFYALQLYYVVPWLGHRIGDAVPALRSRSEAAFGDGNENTEKLRQFEVIGASTGYLTSGASGFSSDLQSQLLISVKNEVDAKMKRHGLDPRAVENSALRDQWIRKRIEAEMKRMGLPGSEEFLFDAASLWQKTVGLFGFKGPSQSPTTNPSDTSTSYLGAERPGLVVPALGTALKLAKVALEQNPDDTEAALAVKVLTAAARDASLLQTFVLGPLRSVLLGKERNQNPGFRQALSDAIAQYRGIRSRLVALTYDGPFDQSMKELPADWIVKAGEPGAARAGTYFRRAFFGMMSGDRALFGLGKSKGIYLEKARQDALVEMGRLFSADFAVMTEKGLTQTAASEELARVHPKEWNEVRQSAEKTWAELVEDVRTGTFGAKYTPPKKDFLARRQEARANRAADEAYLAETGAYYFAERATGPETVLWQKHYSRALIQILGLHLEGEELQARLEQEATGQLERMIDAEPGLKDHLESLNEEAKSRFVANLFAETVVQGYLQETIYQEKISTLSELQPGRFQKWRQTEFVKASKLLTRFTRLGESFFSDSAYRTGLMPWLDRNIPSFSDLRLANVRAYRASLTSATAGYWVNRTLWMNALSPAMWAWAFMFRFTVGMPAQVLNRMFRMQGWRPMGRFYMMAAFAVVFSWCTFGGAIPEQLFAADFQGFWNQVTHTQPPHPVTPSGNCEKMLVPKDEF